MISFDTNFGAYDNLSEATAKAMAEARDAKRAAGLAVQYIDDNGKRNEVCCTDAAHRDDFIRRICFRGWQFVVSA